MWCHSPSFLSSTVLHSRKVWCFKAAATSNGSFWLLSLSLPPWFLRFLNRTMSKKKGNKEKKESQTGFRSQQIPDATKKNNLLAPKAPIDRNEQECRNRKPQCPFKKARTREVGRELRNKRCPLEWRILGYAPATLLLVFLSSGKEPMEGRSLLWRHLAAENALTERRLLRDF